MTLFPRSLLLNTIQRSNSPVICDNSSRSVGVRLLSSRKMWMLKLLAFALVLAVFCWNHARNLVEIDTRHAVLDLVKSAPGHTEVSALINMGQVEPKQGREKRL